MISNVYNYYMSEYSARPYNRHNTHKKSELREIYNNIVKLNRSSPFYDVDISEESQAFAIDIKESARSLYDVAADLTDAASGDMTFKSIAQSDNPDYVDAEYIGDNQTAGSSRSFNIGVKQLATPQVNTGAYLRTYARNLFTGTYSFDVDIASITYELQFTVNDKENNLDIQKKLCRLINNSNIGLSAKVLTDESKRSAIEITSNMTGMGDKPVIFSINDDQTTALSGAVETLGLNNTTSYPSNAVFTLNGDEKVSASNVFTVDRQFEVTLKKPTESDVKIGLKQNLDSLVDSIHELADGFNKLSALSQESTSAGGRRLHSDLNAIANVYNDILNSNGLSITEEGLIDVDDEKLKSSSNEDLMSTLSQIGKFKNALQKKANDIMLNPMDYINKCVISYKNPKHPDGDTYTTSIYSGMIFNGYC